MTVLPRGATPDIPSVCSGMPGSNVNKSNSRPRGWCDSDLYHSPHSILSRDGNHTVWFADASDMSEIPDGSIDLVCTSPPYGIGMDYSGESPPLGMPGSTPGQVEAPVMNWTDYLAYLRRLEPVWREVYRTMTEGAFAVINIAPIHSKSAYFEQPSSMLPTVERTAIFWMDQLGATYRWRYEWDTLRTKTNSKGEATTWLGSYGKHKDGVYGLPCRGQVLRQLESILVFQKGTDSVFNADRDARRRLPLSRITEERWAEIFSQVWDFKGDTQGGDHPATFPVELPLRVIQGFSVTGDTVLDPFMGSGTTALAASQLGRKSIGYEVERRFEDTICRKTGLFPGPLDTHY